MYDSDLVCHRVFSALRNGAIKVDDFIRLDTVVQDTIIVCSAIMRVMPIGDD